MKKLITIMLVAMVPFITMAQKRSKKDKDSNNKYEFMIIKGVEVSYDQIDGRDPTDMPAGDIVSQEQIHILLKGKAKLMISFDSGDNRSEDIAKLMKSSQGMRSMADAVNMAASYGWQFVNATVVDKDIALIHYYYMQRTK
ncbi:MAG TPA: hypothetical protein QGG91_04925 [Flavobacteriales bacterium]|jgi:hypothetical protein|nr:hypothetical protein [Flavobacteriales bacterium]|tara:strand:- start:3589 stop:4011 length:423 start_codon:yes stop_codon:yes gene_type:complete